MKFSQAGETRSFATWVSSMKKHLLPLLLACAVHLVSARDKASNWLEARSQHFTVITDGNEKQARHVAGQFERMRSVFHSNFPSLQLDPAVPIVVIAVKDQSDMRALEPEAYLAKGSLELGGVFVRTPDKNYVLMRLDASGDHPYRIVYHEYTHLVFSKAEEWLPLWFKEGNAEFYENTVVHARDADVGLPGPEAVYVLHHHPLLPLNTLFAVDWKSPYYHDEDKGTIFYAESWVLIHYLTIRDANQKTHLMTDYLHLMGENLDSVTAATRAFGDLDLLRRELEGYVERATFHYSTIPIESAADDSSFDVHGFPTPQADAYRADFLANSGREKDARGLLDQVLHQDPDNGLAHETLGYLAFRQGHTDEARQWYEQAVKLDSQSYVAQYYFAAMSMNSGAMSADAENQVEASLKAAIKLNPNFAPPYDRLAVFYGMRRKNLGDAHMLGLQAIQLDPTNIGYRINTAKVLADMDRYGDALTVFQNALKITTDPDQITNIQFEMNNIEETIAARKRVEEQKEKLKEEMKAELAIPPTTAATDPQAGSGDVPGIRPEETLRGPHVSELGTIKNVQCSYPAKMDFELETGGHLIALHSPNYYKIPFSVLNFTPRSALKPCSDLEGTRARVEYVAPSGKTKAGGIVTIEMIN